ncbi:MAG: hypothetical protein ACI9VR_002510 [Cognaticolwellia sp.]|jgi:hypothetical protein
MSSAWLYWALLAHMGLVVFIYLLLLQRKTAAGKAGEIDRKRTAVDPSAWPVSVQLVNNNLISQFQIPVMVYACALALAQLDSVDWFGVVAIWAFVLLRIGHTAVHVTTNKVPYRMRLFTAGTVACVVLMGRLGWALIG